MALEQLVEVLTREAQAEAVAVLERARADAEGIRSGRAAAVAARRAASRSAAEAARRAAVERALVEARHAARAAELEARRRLLDRVFAAARAALPQTLERAEYDALLARELPEALRCMGERPATLRCPPVLEHRLAALVADRGHVHVVPDPAAGSGFRLVGDDGSMEIDATLESRLDRLAPRLALAIAAAVGTPA